jgi:ammonia channel protein AmtB
LQVISKTKDNIKNSFPKKIQKYFLKIKKGGTPVHITSGFSALAYALAVGPRRTVDFKKLKPSSPADIYLGTALLWFGWFGFNGEFLLKFALNWLILL